ncbi:UPF0149 family protein [Alloalcanivorax profundimaris]|jgi:uncharacterized protein YgfB (UPF0149 family)|uniref:UPF0149 family protein n=1 Tax=Alloalcanivorax profundimaris TaxID=2735259 RepID=UPI000C66A895|nr:UPF0149 family protein [Alloalcanivorax profundimaris]MAO59471.1 hypothetical protein [Alcanivorax sp.]MAY11850.1 hypothetical protein [Alcanivorax sp.]MBF1803475.1 UPF0149 family protein [Alloalcanivorax profundimaris]MBI56370.1 hypothetical protein [Alcanivorax sp.]MBU60706.1 hypothetical protein [Alcanivorax sp.]|tara:strand:- start:1251 stop:1841 length:591 start_codon:yes stop_codon:yes gene_type:complete
MPDLPDFDHLVRAASGAGVAVSPSELHGVICGLLATGQGHDDATLLGTLAAHAEQPQGLAPDLAGDLVLCRDAASEGFAGTGLELDLLLPDDEDDLGLRVAALGQWAEGFLVGFGTGAAGVNDSQLSPGIQEALSDLSAISQVSTPEDDGEEEERMLEQVTEHCRMAAMMIYTDLVMKPAARDTDTKTDTNPPTRH